MSRWAPGIALLGVALTALAVSVMAWCAADQPLPNGWMEPQMSPQPAPAGIDAETLAQGYELAVLVAWLSAAAFAAGLVIGIATHRRGGLWAAAATTVFLSLILTVGSRPAPSHLYRPAIAVSGVWIVMMAALGGWVGQSLWQDPKVPPSPPTPDPAR